MLIKIRYLNYVSVLIFFVVCSRIINEFEIAAVAHVNTTEVILRLVSRSDRDCKLLWHQISRVQSVSRTHTVIPYTKRLSSPEE